MGGAINGQVVMWDIAKSLASIDQKKRKQSVRHIGKPGLGVGGDDDEPAAALPPVKPHAVSHIDLSHRRLVADLAWLPTTTQVREFRWQVEIASCTWNSWKICSIVGLIDKNGIIWRREQDFVRLTT